MLCTNVSTSGETYAPAVGKKFGLVKPNCYANARTVLFKSLYSNCRLKGGRLPRPRYITLCLRPTSNACSNTFRCTALALVRKQLGLTNPNFFPTAGAYVSPEVETFVHSIGLDMLVGYGLTESVATVSCDHRGRLLQWVQWEDQ